MAEHLTTEKPSHAGNIMEQAAADDGYVSPQTVSQDQRHSEEANPSIVEQCQNVEITEQNKDIGEDDKRSRGGVEENKNSADNGATESEITARPRRNAKPSLKSIESRMQTDKEKLEKLWEKVLDTISQYAVTPDSPTEIDTAIKCIRAAFHQVQVTWLSYVEFLVLGNTPECKSEQEQIDNIMNNRKRYVQSLLSEYSKTWKDLLLEMGSIRSNSRASSVSSVAVRAQARAEVAAAMKKVEMQKQRSLAELQSNLLIQQEEMALARRKREEEAHMESLRLEEEAAVAMAKAAAIDLELGSNTALQDLEIELPEVSSKQRVEEYIYNQCSDNTPPKNTPISPQVHQQAPPPAPQVPQVHQQAPPPAPQVPQVHQQAPPPAPQVPQVHQQALPPAPQVPQVHQQAPPPAPRVLQAPLQEFPGYQQTLPVDPSNSDHHQASTSSTLRPLATEFHPEDQKHLPTSSTDFMKAYVDFMARRELIANKIEKSESCRETSKEDGKDTPFNI